MLRSSGEGRKRSDEKDPPAEANSVFGEILDWMLAPLLVIWPLSIAITYGVAHEIADAPYDYFLGENLRAVSQTVQISDKGVKLRLSAPIRAYLRADDQDSLFYQVRNPRGEVVTGDEGLPGFVADSAIAPREVYFRNDIVNGEEVRVAYEFLPGHPGGDGSLILVQVAETKKKRLDMTNRIVSGVLAPQFAYIPLAVILVYLGLSHGIAPLHRLQSLIERRRPSDLSALSERGVPTEVLPLIRAFNDMMARLEQNQQAQHRFIADAAHQMRTPLTGLKMQTELALLESDPAEIRASLQRIAASGDRAAHLVNQLLTLARAEASSETTHKVELVDLEQVVTEVARDLAPLALAKRVDFGAELSGEPLLMEGNRLQLVEMLKNLIDNAIKYTPSGGKVTVRTVPSHFAAVEIEDNGSGIQEGDRQLVFERFYRSPEQTGEGSGLGLAIVREIANLHRGSVQLKPNPAGQGTLAVVTFPRRRAPVANPPAGGHAFPLA